MRRMVSTIKMMETRATGMVPGGIGAFISTMKMIIGDITINAMGITGIAEAATAAVIAATAAAAVATAAAGINF